MTVSGEAERVGRVIPNTPFNRSRGGGLRIIRPTYSRGAVFFSASVSFAPAVLMARATAGEGRVSVMIVKRDSNGVVRLNAFRPNLELSSAKIVRSAAAIILRWAATMSAL